MKRLQDFEDDDWKQLYGELRRRLIALNSEIEAGVANPDYLRQQHAQVSADLARVRRYRNGDFREAPGVSADAEIERIHRRIMKYRGLPEEKAVAAVSEWTVEVRPKHASYPGQPDLVVMFRRNGVLIATVYPTEQTPGLQIISDVLDFEHAHRGLPDGDGGQVIHEVRIEAGQPLGSAYVPSRWLGLMVQE
jgi:hypothetical protein